mmetsp:Transcript_70292/g.203829  ORF Transcript_70292/g.203829 Transcript_70292/m.203829 type:complete len:315 (+) Transcript_70292:1287-2231(+)
MIRAKPSDETENPNSTLAYWVTSLPFKAPSLSASYFRKRAPRFSNRLKALAFFTALSVAAFAERTPTMALLRQPFVRCCNLTRSSFASAMSFRRSSVGALCIKGEVDSRVERFVNTKSTQALQAVRASPAAAATSRSTRLASSSPITTPSKTGVRASLNRPSHTSAFSTKPDSSPSMRRLASSCSFRRRSSSCRRASSFSRCSLTACTCARAASICWRASSRIPSAKLPHFGNSWLSVSSTCRRSSSKFSGVADRMSIIAFLAAKAECCSSRRRSSSCCFRMYSSCCRRRASSSCCRWRRACCCWRTRSSSCRL